MPRRFSSGRRSVSTPVSALHERGLAVIDVPGGAEDHGCAPSAACSHAAKRAQRPAVAQVLLEELAQQPLVRRASSARRATRAAAIAGDQRADAPRASGGARDRPVRGGRSARRARRPTRGGTMTVGRRIERHVALAADRRARARSRARRRCATHRRARLARALGGRARNAVERARRRRRRARCGCRRAPKRSMSSATAIAPVKRPRSSASSRRARA